MCIILLDIHGKILCIIPFTTNIFFTVNLTPHEQVVHRTTHAEYSAHLAIKGPATNKRADGCYISAIGQTYEWWGLQLPAVAYMTNIVIYSLEECKLYYNCMKR